MSGVSTRLGFEADFIFRAGDLAPDALKVTAFKGTEAISELFHFRIELCSTDASIDVDAVLGKPCTLEIAGPSGSRFVNGIVRAFERVGEGHRLTHYAAEVDPVHWLLTKRFNSRIFQEHNCPDMTVPGIIKEVLKDAGIPEDNQRFALQGEYEKREYVVEYRETEMAFISRLMEEEGIFYFFEHDAENHKMVFGDSPVAHASNPATTELRYRAPTGLLPEEEHVTAVRDRQELQFGAVCLEDFDFSKPGEELRVTAKSEQQTALEFSDYPGNYTEKTIGQRYAQIRLEELQARQHVLDMEATARRLLAGFKFSLVEHPSTQLNREYLITRIVHDASQLQSGEAEAGPEEGFRYTAGLRVIPSDVPFRPLRKTPRPVVRGSQTAIVVGGETDEIHTDKFGRVRVQFHWDREGKFDANSSCFIRVSQSWAGGRYGSIFLPRVGQEVIVDFLEGDPDRPIITGRVYNGELMPPYPLPDERSRSTTKTNSTPGGGGCNEIRFEDAKDKEQILVFAQRNHDVRVGAERMSSIGGSDHLTVEKERREKIKADLSQSVGGSHKLSVGKQLAVKTGGDVTVDCGGNYGEASCDRWLKAGALWINADDGIYLNCGASMVAIDGDAVWIEGPMVHINDGLPDQPPFPDFQDLGPAEPAEADTTKPGQDVRFSGGGVIVPPVEPEKLEKRKTFVEFQLVDSSRERQPVPRERVRVRLPDGKVEEGITNAEGVVRFDDIDPGNAEIQFPDREDHEWSLLKVKSTEA
jgi:type VI secretion system secreted protein VgrG